MEKKKSVKIQKRKKIIDKAWELFAKNGYEETKVEDITRELGVSKGSFYTYFATKEELLYEVLEKIKKECFEDEIFKTDYTKEVVDYVKNKYGDKLEFLWEKSPKTAVVRRKNSNKWYALILTLSKRKLNLNSDEAVAKAKDFSKALESTSIGKDIKNCTKDVRHNNGSVNKTGKSNGTLKIWADVNSHALKAVEIKGKGKDSSASLSLDIDTSKTESIDIPSNAASLKSVVEELFKGMSSSSISQSA